jgi:LPPG:FO 2-phospho-L-lactate transferase
MILALAGGVGGSKLANGLARNLPPSGLVVAVNTGDDFEHLGLFVSPDLDTVMYTLAGRNNPVTGWGLANETWHFMDAVAQLGGETWFRLGDHDLATHVERTRRLRQGQTLSEVTQALCAAFGVAHRIVPMCDQRVATMLETDIGRLSFQHYLVRERTAPVVRTVEFDGVQHATASAGFAAALADARLAAIVIAPSNPFLSIGPILAVPGVREAIARAPVPRIAVSPIIAGEAVKGPAAKMMREFGHEASSVTVANVYAGIVDALVIDIRDRHLRGAIEAQGLRVHVTDTLMRGPEDQARLAREVLAFAADISARRTQADSS